MSCFWNSGYSIVGVDVFYLYDNSDMNKLSGFDAKHYPHIILHYPKDADFCQANSNAWIKTTNSYQFLTQHIPNMFGYTNR